jgi:glyoxylase-like metal-dependent hydrolase (beta-lactamase superfamily II)
MTDAYGLLPEGVIVLERGWLSSNNILLADGESAALVDSGYATHAAQTVAMVSRELHGRSLRHLLNTHLHSDHCGGNAALQRQFRKLQTLIPPGQVAYVRDWDPVALTYVPTGQVCPQFSAHGVLHPGSEFRLGDLVWEVHAAPGHDPHSLIFFERSSRTLLSADALWENGFGVVFPELEGEAAFDEVGATLDLIEALDPAVVVPGHGRVFSDVEAAIERARTRLEGFVANPAKHAMHAAKVLLKFKLLELQQVELADFVEWASQTAYFEIVRSRWFSATAMPDWIAHLCNDLVRTRAAHRQGDVFLNA